MFLSNTSDNFVLIEQDPEDVFVQDNDGNLWESKHDERCCWIIEVIHLYEYDHCLKGPCNTQLSFGEAETD